MASPEFRRLIASPLAESSQDVSSLLGLALQQLISLAGGWETRSQYRRPAYESKAVLQVRASLRLLGQCSSLLAKEVGVGTFSRKLEQLLNRLKHRGFVFTATSRAVLQKWLDSMVGVQRAALSSAVREMRDERIQRFKQKIPALWAETPSILYRWLKGDTPSWGSVPILTNSGSQCTSIEEVDRTVQDYWVQSV